MIAHHSNIIEISVKPGVQPQIDAALALRSSGRLEEALRALANPTEYNPYLYTVRGEIEFRLGHFHDAALSYFAVVQSEPDNADAHYNLALCLQRSDRWDASCQAFERALSLEQGSLDHERAVLADYGNMSSPTVLFVLDRIVRAGMPSRTLLTAMGPGFTSSCVSLKRAA